jgi:hypothetical protein
MRHPHLAFNSPKISLTVDKLGAPPKNHPIKPATKPAAPAITTRIKCHLVPPFREILAILMDVQEYRSPTEAFESFLGHWAQAPQKHALTRKHALAKGFAREAHGRRLLSLLRSGRSADGHWLILKIHDAIRRLAPAATAQPPPAVPEPQPVEKNFGTLNPAVTANMTGAYAEILRLMRIREGYRSPAEALESFLAHWALAAHRHKLTGQWAAARGMDRENRGQEMLAQYLSGKPIKGSWLKARIYAAIKADLGQDAKSPTINDVLAILPDVVDEALEKEFP